VAIPDWDQSTRHLPPGRYRATLAEIHELLVSAPAFAASETRQQVWSGFVRYLAAWRQVQAGLAAELNGNQLILALWLGGSFVSQKPNPSNLDLTVLVDGELVESCHGRPGIGALHKLTSRDKMLITFKVSPCVIQYHYFRSPFRSQIVGNAKVQDYVMFRGAFDDWWQRARPDDLPKAEPTRETAGTLRGYLEVAG
jgi:hypothetical protein